jgi:hypothetical protein
VTTSLNPRLLLVLGAVLAAALVALAYLQLGRGDDNASVLPETPVTPQTSSTAKPSNTSKVELLPGLPAPVAGKLRRSKVVVVSVYQGSGPDDLRAIAGGRKGASDVGAAFVSVNLATESTAQEMAPFIGGATAPLLLVVKRPGTIVTRINGPVDGELVAQAAYNAGARRR